MQNLLSTLNSISIRSALEIVFYHLAEVVYHVIEFLIFDRHLEMNVRRLRLEHIQGHCL